LEVDLIDETVAFNVTGVEFLTLPFGDDFTMSGEADDAGLITTPRAVVKALRPRTQRKLTRKKEAVSQS
jgi:hypothetical protein